MFTSGHHAYQINNFFFFETEKRKKSGEKLTHSNIFRIKVLLKDATKRHEYSVVLDIPNYTMKVVLDNLIDFVGEYEINLQADDNKELLER